MPFPLSKKADDGTLPPIKVFKKKGVPDGIRKNGI
jgi:hypothetical protein